MAQPWIPPQIGFQIAGYSYVARFERWASDEVNEAGELIEVWRAVVDDARPVARAAYGYSKYSILEALQDAASHIADSMLDVDKKVTRADLKKFIVELPLELVDFAALVQDHDE